MAPIQSPDKSPERSSGLPPGPHPSINLIDYQNGSVVSKELLKTKQGHVSLFAFDQGQGLSEHTSPYEVLLCVIDGEAEISITETDSSVSESKVKEGEMIRLPANQPHAVFARERFKMLLIMLKNN